MNPEYLREETAYNDTLNPWIILIGEYDKNPVICLAYCMKASLIAQYIDARFVKQKYKNTPIIFSTRQKLLYYNEMRQIANHIGVDADKIFKYTAISCEGMWNPKYGIKTMGPFKEVVYQKIRKHFLIGLKQEDLMPLY